MEEVTLSPKINKNYKFKSPRRDNKYKEKDPSKKLTFEEELKERRKRYPQDFNLLDEECTFSPNTNKRRYLFKIINTKIETETLIVLLMI